VPKTKDNSSKRKPPKTNSKKGKPRSANKKEKNNFEDQFNELQDRHIRLKAEFDNFRRRKSEEISKLLQYDGENVIVGFLPIIDDLNRMIDSEDASNDSLLDGIDLVKNKIAKFFEKLNIEPFGEHGDKMDTDIHDAMLTQSDEKYEDDIILEVFEKGYTYRDKVIRHAKVIVNKK
tara:strand:- start:658 stop:1185 length:528 start_codon:yes stop_codon:yes gene_type:complete